MHNRYQFVFYWPRYEGFCFVRYDKQQTNLGFIYVWWLDFGFWALQKWALWKEAI